MRFRLLLLFQLGWLLPFTLPAQKTSVHSLTGYVREAVTGKPIAGATVFVQNNRKGTRTGSDGYFVIPLPEGKYTVRFSHVGYVVKTEAVTLNKLLLLNVELAEDSQYLQEVVVQTEAPDRNVRKVEMGVTQLSIKNIKRIPAFMGEVDIVRSLLLLPGVTTVGEGATGFNVRGGSVDQNLVLLDEVPLFNTSHLFGFFSVFNPDVVRDATLHRGGIAAGYGGRASSVLDIKIKEPEAEKWTLNGGIGLVSSRLGVEGPVIPRKLSVLAATRVSVNDFLFQLGPPSLRGTKANFYDLTTKVKFQPNEQHTVTFTGYVSRDVFKLPSDSLASLEVNASSTRFDYETMAGAVRWNYFISKRFNLATTAIWSRYQTETSVPDSSNAFRLQAEVLHRQVRSDLSINVNEKHQVQTGASLIDYSIQPNRLVPGPFSNVLPVVLPIERAYEVAAYVQDDWNLTSTVALQLGLRYSALLNRGPADVRTYSPEQPREPGTAAAEQEYGAGKIYHSSGGIEPRLAVRWNLAPGQSVKAGYHRLRQYINLITNTTAALPTSRWKLADQNVSPVIADQWSLGYFRNINNDAIELSAEVYYKTLQNALDYKDGADLTLNALPETDLLQGRGQAYGLETQLRKNKGAWTGWVSYTYSRTFLTIDSPFVEERINGGRAYPANFDKPHTLNATATYRPSLRFSLSLNFTYSTGRPITQPYGRAVINGVRVPIFINRNQERIPDYHRLDFSMLFEQDPARQRRVQQSWVFAIYNVYAHKNAYSVFYRFDPRQDKDAFKLAIFGSVFPSLTWNFKF